MEIMVRLYRQFDLDLIYLAHYDDFSLVRTAKSCIRAYATQKAFRISLPEGRLASGSNDKTTYEYKFSLDPKEDEAAIRLLRSVRNRHRNAFIKNLIRGYMVAPFTRAYLDDEQLIQDGTDAFELITRGKDTIPSIGKKRTSSSTRYMEGEEAENQVKGQKRLQGVLGVEFDTAPAKKPSPRKKKNPVTALGELMLTPRETDGSIHPIKSDSVRTDTPTEEIQQTLQSMLFPAADIKKSEPAVKKIPAGNDNELMDAIGSLVTDY